MIKFVDDSFSDSVDTVCIKNISVTYSQLLDADQCTTDYPEDEQTITFQTADSGFGTFVRFHTGKAGWGFDDVNDVIKIFKDFDKRRTVTED